MFGLGKLVSSLTGGLFDKIGLGFLSPLVSMAVNFFSGNYLALIGDVTSLVSRFSNSSFLKNLSQLNPLGSFGQGTNCFGDILSSGSRFNLLRTTAQLLGLNKADRMLGVVDEFRNSFGIIQHNREVAFFNQRY